MTQRNVDSGYWSDPDIQPLPFEVKALYLYTFTNDHCNSAGLYSITLRTIAFEMTVSEEQVKEWLAVVEKQGKVSYDARGLLWVKGFLRRQSRSPKFLEAAAKCLRELDHQFPAMVKALVDHNDTLSIPYRYPIGTVSGNGKQAQRGYPIDTLSIPSAQDQPSPDKPRIAQPRIDNPPTTLPAEDDVSEIYRLFNDCIRPVNEIIRGEIDDALKYHTAQQVKAAITEAAKHSATSWGYVAKILKNPSNGHKANADPPDAMAEFRQEMNHAR